VQIFLPYADIEQSARVLDTQRLMKQRVESYQISTPYKASQLAGAVIPPCAWCETIKRGSVYTPSRFVKKHAAVAIKTAYSLISKKRFSLILTSSSLIGSGLIYTRRIRVI